MNTSLRNLRVAVYARFSSENQRDASIDDQVRLCREFVARNEGDTGEGWILTDYAVSGRSIAREGFDELLRLVESRRVDVVVTESGDRLTPRFG
jgi:site-specific DNA recombinase